MRKITFSSCMYSSFKVPWKSEKSYSSPCSSNSFQNKFKGREKEKRLMGKQGVSAWDSTRRGAEPTVWRKRRADKDKATENLPSESLSC